MRKLFTLLFLCLSIFAFAQPSNDGCAGIIDLGVAPVCDSTVFYTNLDATASNIGNDNIPALQNCSGLGPMQRDVWFSFIASDTIDDYLITVTGIMNDMGSTAMNMPQIAIYRGDCEFDGMELYDCKAAVINNNVVEIEVSGLDPGIPYIIRITDYSATALPNSGSFQLCIKEKPPVIILDENQTTTLCSGEIYDSGGPDGDYGPNQNFTFTIIPPAPVGCIEFTLNYFNIAATGTDAIRIYNGPNTTSPLLATLTGGLNGGGGVSYTVYATSGALTLQFVSDGSIQLDGFYGTWQCFATPCEIPALIQVSDVITPEMIVDAVASPATTVTVTSINCPQGAYGTFDGGDFTNLGLNKGIVLTSGRVLGPPGTGINAPGAQLASTGWGSPGDADLNTLSSQIGGGSLSNDACIIELDVYAATDELSFEYIFGSEEYPEFVGGSFNDIFAFLVSGPGIVGDPGLNGQKNIAVLPPPLNLPVQVNSVNNITNWQFYRNNMNGPSLVYDGLTSDFLGVKPSLTASIQVIPCNTYHLKLAIADRGDSILDSGVFVAEIKGGTPSLGINWNNSIDYLVEECSLISDEITIGLSSPQEAEVTYNIAISGTATLGEDYLLDLPSQITFPAGTTSFNFPITVLPDGVFEGIETVVIQLTANFGCGTVVYDELVIEIHDQLNVEILAGVDTAYVCLGIGVELDVKGAAEYLWSPAGVFTNPVGATPFANPTQDTMVYVVGTLGICFAVDSVFLDVVDPQVQIQPIGPTGICQGDTIALVAVNNVGNSGLAWSPNGSILGPLNSQAVQVAPLFNTTYSVQVQIAGCTANNAITINVDPFTFPTLAFAQTTICQNYPVTLANQITGVTTQYQWSANPPDPSLTDPTQSGPTVTPDVSTVYTLLATSQNGYCSETASLLVNVVPADVDILNPAQDSVEICLGSSVPVFAQTTTLGLGLQWIPLDGTISDPNSVNPTMTPTVSTTYYAILTVDACVVVDSIHIRVDSLPFNEITQLIPQKDIYCQGETVTIVSPNYEPAHFPDITHLWTPNVGHLTPDTLWNLVIGTVETTVYTRTTTNRACVSAAEIEIVVVPNFTVLIEPSQSAICEGESIQLTASSPDADVETYEWSPPSNLSCTDCPNPVATPSGSITYQVKGDISGCSTSASATIEVVVLPDITFPEAPARCPGDPITLNMASLDVGATYIWTADPPDPSLTDPTLHNPTVEPLVTTTYIVTVQKPGCPPRSDTITVVVLSEPPVLSVSPDAIICIGDDITLTASANASGSFLWSPGGETTASITVSPTETTLYTVEYTSACYTFSETVVVDVSSGFVIDSIVVTPPGEVFEGTLISLEAFTTPSSLLEPLYLWYLGLDSIGAGVGLNPFQTEAPSVDEDAMVFQYNVQIIDAIGCTANASIDIVVNDSQYEIPNAFSPDGDGVNDRFRVLKNAAVTIVEFKIFNRWGQMVYDNDSGDAGWDGNYKGKAAPSDVYAYVILLRLGDGTEKPEIGEVTLLR